MLSPFLILYKMDLKPLVNLNTLILEGMLMFLFIYFGSKEFRDKYNEGILKFWQGMTTGFIIYGCMTLVFLGFLWVFIYYLQPDFLEIYKLEAVEYLKDSVDKIKDEEERTILVQQISIIESTTRENLLMDGLLKKLVLGLIITPISTVFLRRY